MIKEVIVVEGKNDVHAIKRAVEADCLTTGGFGLSPYSINKIQLAYTKRGIIILTDPDCAGERIRRFLSERFPEAKHAFVPKEDATAKNDIGIEQASAEAIRMALSKVHYQTFQPGNEFSLTDLMNFGLNGIKDAGTRRALMGAKLGIGYANAKTFLQRLNNYGVTRTEFEQALQEISHSI